MAFQMVKKYRIYTCKSTDVKKTDNVDSGSWLYETDVVTNKTKKYIFENDSWVHEIQAVDSGEDFKVKIWDGTNEAGIIPTDGDYGLVVIQPNHTSSSNSTTTPLGSDEVFLGVGENVENYADIRISMKTDEDSKENGLEIQFSFDNEEWITTDQYTITADDCKTFSVPALAPYYRTKYTNGSTEQTMLCIYVKFCINQGKGSSHRIDDEISGQDDAELMKSVITGKKSNGMFDNVSLTNGGNMKISLEELESGISSNNNSQLNTTMFDSAGNEAKINYGSQVTITHAHKEVHGGGHFVTGYLFEGVENDENADIRVLNGTTKEIHLIVTAIVEAKTYGYLFEDTTYTVDGTALDIHNNNRRSANTSTAAAYHTPTVNVLGTEIYPQYLIPAGQKSAAIGGNASNGQEIILAPNKDYLIRNTSKAGAGTNKDILIILEWYEETV